ncbi:DUF3597 domain-containing protein [Agrobacterium tumefaciens]|nr:DUF3597 domain-containing protein [Agrobacterium tumefaciens]TQN59151.1 DUF3597 domain-containing protein [Agrobacterium tumefaciens]
MGIFDRIKHALFGEAHAAQNTAQAAPTLGVNPTAASSSPAAPVQPAPVAPVGSATSAASPAGQQTQAPGQVQSSAPTSPSATSGRPVDIETILNDAVKKSGQKLDWRHSIVDLMKALGMDASLEERKELAGELGYTGDIHDSAKMNTFLHKALMKKLSENGGKVPADLLD